MSFEANGDETLHDGQTSNYYKSSHWAFGSCKLEHSVQALCSSLFLFVNFSIIDDFL